MAWAAIVQAALKTAGNGMQMGAQWQTARQNNALAQSMGREAIRQGKADASDVLAMGGREIGAQRAAYGASGVDVGSGSPLMVALDTLATRQTDAARTIHKAKLRDWGYGIEAAQSRAEGRMALLTGFMNMAGSSMSAFIGGKGMVGAGKLGGGRMGGGLAGGGE